MNTATRWTAVLSLSLCLASAFLLAACASTTITAVRDPGAVPQVHRRILVLATLSELDLRKLAEDAFVKELASRNVHAMPSLQVMPPTRSYSEGEVQRILTDARADAVLVAMLTDAWTEQRYLPPGPSITSGSGTIVGDVVQFTATTYQTPGMVLSRPHVRCQLRLLDVSSGKTVWVASTLTEGRRRTKAGDMAQSVAEAAVKKLAEDGLILSR